jgi:hypothetical protein
LSFTHRSDSAAVADVCHDQRRKASRAVTLTRKTQ